MGPTSKAVIECLAGAVLLLTTDQARPAPVTPEDGSAKHPPAAASVRREQDSIDRIAGGSPVGSANSETACQDLPGTSLAQRAPAPVRKIVEKIAPQYDIDPSLILAVIAVESGFNSAAISPKKAQGLMQLIPETAKRFGVDKPFDPSQNVKGGVRYLRWLLDHFEGDISNALAGYNAGEGAVKRYRGIPPYPETEAYVAKVRKLYGCSFDGHENEVSVADVTRARSILIALVLNLKGVSIEGPTDMETLLGPGATTDRNFGCPGPTAVAQLDADELSDVRPGDFDSNPCR